MSLRAALKQTAPTSPCRPCGIMGEMRKGWMVVWVVLVAAQFYLLYTPDVGGGPGFLAPLWELLRPLPGPTAMGEPGFDKIVHGTSFGLVALTGLLAGWPTWLAIAIPAAHAPVSELVQLFWIDGRAGDWHDLLADWTGILLDWAIIAVWRSRKVRGSHRRREPRSIV